MKSGVKARLERLERYDRGHRVGVMAQVVQAAVAALSDADLQCMKEAHERGATTFEDCTPEEQAALGRYTAECEAWARCIRRATGA